jgi:mannose-6-phosphate isomerase-like protein (cupin superfamily)
VRLPAGHVSGNPRTPTSAERHADEDLLHGCDGCIYFVLEGEGEFNVGTESRLLGAGYAVLAPADVNHGVRNPGEGQLIVLVFMAPNPNVS